MDFRSCRGEKVLHRTDLAIRDFCVSLLVGRRGRRLIRAFINDVYYADGSLDPLRLSRSLPKTCIRQLGAFFTLAKGHTCKPALTTLERDMDLGAVKLLQHLSFFSGHLVNQPEDGANKLQNGEVEGSEESV